MELFPPSVKNLIEDEHLCMIFNDVVKEIDLSCLYQKNPMKAIQQCSADGGYSSGENIKAMEKREMELTSRIVNIRHNSAEKR